MSKIVDSLTISCFGYPASTWERRAYRNEILRTRLHVTAYRTRGPDNRCHQRTRQRRVPPLRTHVKINSPNPLVSVGPSPRNEHSEAPREDGGGNELCFLREVSSRQIKSFVLQLLRTRESFGTGVAVKYCLIAGKQPLLDHIQHIFIAGTNIAGADAGQGTF